MPTRVIEVELSSGIHDVRDLDRYDTAFVVVRWYGRPLGQLWIKVGPNQTILSTDLCRAIADEFGWNLTQQSLKNWLLGISEPLTPPTPSSKSVSVIVCTRDRPDDLRRCLDALMTLSTPNVEIVVVDNAPPDDGTAQLAATYPVIYVREDRQGLNWARAKGARVASGEIVVYTDDDVIVDAGWVNGMLTPFDDPRVACVTGLVLPFELETDAQHLFERYGGFGRGYERRVYDYTSFVPASASRIGAGASMAFRRAMVNRMGLFDSEMDCGTAVLTGGDAYAFYRLLNEGFHIVYTPDALAWHRHRRSREALRKTLYGYSVGGFAFLLRCLLHHGDMQSVKIAWQWFRWHHLYQLKQVLRRNPQAYPIDMTLAEILGALYSVSAYFKSRRREREAVSAPVSVKATAQGGSR
jgi:GT2 family glycosyltransferase